MLFFVNEVIRSIGKNRAICNLVTGTREVDLRDQSLDMWITGTGKQISICPHRISEVGLGCDELGKPVSFFDGEVHRSDDLEVILQLASNELVLEIGADLFDFQLPSFLSDSPTEIYSLQIELQFLIEDIGHLPFFEANLAHLERFEDAIRTAKLANQPEPFPELPPLYSQELKRIASGLCVFECKLFPVKLNSSKNYSYAVFNLEQVISNEICSGSLYVSELSLLPKRGDFLLQEVSWLDDGGNHSKTAQLGMIEIIR